MYGSHGLPSQGGSSTFSFKDQQIFEIFDFQEQLIKESFTMIRYFNKDARRKLVFSVTKENTLHSFYVKPKLSLGKVASDSKHCQSITVLLNGNEQDNTTPQKLRHTMMRATPKD